MSLDNRYAAMGFNSQEDVFSTASGFADDFDGMVVDAQFAPDMQYNSGQSMLLQLEIVSDDPDVGVQKIMYPVGAGWQSFDGGKTVVHEKKKWKFLGTTIYGKVLTQMLETLGLDDTLRQRGFAPFDANMWIGFRAHWQRAEIEFKGTGAPASTSRLFPTKSYGFASTEEVQRILAGSVPVFEGNAAPISSSTQANSGMIPNAPSATLGGSVNTTGNQGESPIVMALRTIAQTSENYADFVKNALRVPGVNDAVDSQGRPIFSLIIDGKSGYFESLRAMQ